MPELVPQTPIRLLWPTARPDIMKVTHKHWMDAAHTSSNITLTVAVNTPKQKELLPDFDVIVVGDNRKGPVWPTHCLAKQLKAKPKDIVILVSDDFMHHKIGISGCVVSLRTTMVALWLMMGTNRADVLQFQS